MTHAPAISFKHKEYIELLLQYADENHEVDLDSVPLKSTGRTKKGVTDALKIVARTKVIDLITITAGKYRVKVNMDNYRAVKVMSSQSAAKTNKPFIQPKVAARPKLIPKKQHDLLYAGRRYEDEENISPWEKHMNIARSF